MGSVRHLCDGRALSTKKGLARPFIFSEEEEEELAEWYKENEFLYKRGMKEYKNKSRKDRMYEEKAACSERDGEKCNYN